MTPWERLSPVVKRARQGSTVLLQTGCYPIRFLQPPLQDIQKTPPANSCYLLAQRSKRAVPRALTALVQGTRRRLSVLRAPILHCASRLTLQRARHASLEPTVLAWAAVLKILAPQVPGALDRASRVTWCALEEIYAPFLAFSYHVNVLLGNSVTRKVR